MKIIFIFAIVTYSLQSFGHARLSLNGTLKPRSTSPGIKVGPCGSGTDTPNPDSARVVLTAGQNLTVNWEETINHPGYFRIAFSPANDMNFDSNILANNIPHQDLPTPHSYSASVVVPITTCNTCTIQLIQYMTENPLNPSLYFSCADIQIVNPGGATPTPTPAPTATPLPLSTPCP